MVLREKLGRSVVEESSNVGASGTPHNPSSVTTEEATLESTARENRRT